MKKSTIKHSIYILTLAIVMIVFSGCSLKLNNNAKQVDNKTQVATSSTSSQQVSSGGSVIDKEDNSGIIKGTMNNPSPIYDGLKTCALDINTKEEYCTNEYVDINIRDDIYITEYSIQVPSGSYYVFTVDQKGRKGYYSEFAVCGLKAECKSSTDLIIVEVKPGEVVENINPLDWYTKR